MSEYYLMSQLPSLDGIGENTAIPITEERFLELCRRFLPKKAQRELERLTLMPKRNAERSASALIEGWNQGEKDLRMAVAKARGEKLKKPFASDNKALPVEIQKAALAAVDMENPLEAEKFLNKFRLEFLESLRPMDTFSEESVFYYGLKLKLLLRMKAFDTEIGKNAYKNIYDSIMSGDRLEVRQ